MRLPTTLLHHATPPSAEAPHHDWLIVDPHTLDDPAARLWTARVGPHWRDWAKLGKIELTPLPPHRRRYLDGAGPVSGGRGHVAVVGRGHVVPRLWTERRIELTLESNGVSVDLRLDLNPDRSWATVRGWGPKSC